MSFGRSTCPTALGLTKPCTAAAFSDGISDRTMLRLGNTCLFHNHQPEMIEVDK